MFLETTACSLCHLDDNPDQTIVLRRSTVLFLQNEKEQGVLRGDLDPALRQALTVGRPVAESVTGSMPTE